MVIACIVLFIAIELATSFPYTTLYMWQRIACMECTKNNSYGDRWHDKKPVRSYRDTMHVQRTNPVVNNRISGLYNHVTSAEYNAIVCDNVSVCPNNQPGVLFATCILV